MQQQWQNKEKKKKKKSIEELKTPENALLVAALSC